MAWDEMKFARAEYSSKPQTEQINNMILWNHRRFIKFKLKPLLLCKSCISSFHLFFLLLAGAGKRKSDEMIFPMSEGMSIYIWFRIMFHKMTL